MSTEDVARFFALLASDESMAQDVDEAVRHAARQAIVDLAATHGCRFTEQEMDELTGEESNELSDDDLDRVAGGYYVLTRTDGRTMVGFGDGIRGRRPSAGAANVSTGYRVGGGSSKKDD